MPCDACWVNDLVELDGLIYLISSLRRTHFLTLIHQVNLGSDKNKGFSLSSPLHPTLSRAYKILEPHFVKDVITKDSHGLLATPASWIKLLMTLPDAADSVKMKLKDKWGSSKDKSTPADKWNELKTSLAALVGKGSSAKASKGMSNADRTRIEQWPVETVFKYTYPRLDINVSKMQNHLLKSPFCVHPKTGRVCVPIEAGDAESFDPFDVPTLARLMRELDDYEAGDDKDNSITCDWQKTSLREPFERFQKQFLTPLLNEERRMQREERERRAAVVGDF